MSADDSMAQNGIQIEASQLYAASFQAFFGDDTAAGTLKVQASNDECFVFYQPGNFTVTNWSDIPDATATVASGASVLIPTLQLAYRWLRVVYTPSGGGSTTINVNMMALAV